MLHTVLWMLWLYLCVWGFPPAKHFNVNFSPLASLLCANGCMPVSETLLFFFSCDFHSYFHNLTFKGCIMLSIILYYLNTFSVNGFIMVFCITKHSNLYPLGSYFCASKKAGNCQLLASHLSSYNQSWPCFGASRLSLHGAATGWQTHSRFLCAVQHMKQPYLRTVSYLMKLLLLIRWQIQFAAFCGFIYLPNLVCSAQKLHICL